MDILIIVLLIIVAVALFLIEVFLIPGISIAGVLAAGSLIYANYYAFAYMGTTAGIATLVVSAVACVASIVLFMRSKTLERVSLKKDITSKIDKSTEQSIKVGDKGVTTTRLALMGNAEFEGKEVEVKSRDGFLDERIPVVVVRISDGLIIVEENKNN